MLPFRRGIERILRGRTAPIVPVHLDRVWGSIFAPVRGKFLGLFKLPARLPVPITVSIDSPMTAEDYVKSVHIFADGNPRPDVASFHFTPACGVATCSTRIRLAKTQNIVAVAEMSNGDVYMAKSEVKVTIGGCGG